MSGASTLRVAAAQYPIEFIGTWARFERKVRSWVGEAAQAGAQLLVFPEYASMELASLFSEDVYSDLQEQLLRLQALLPDYLALFQALARQHQVYVVAGSFPARVGDEFRNRAYIFSPAGQCDFQEKLIMTRFEDERWIVKPGAEAKVFDTAHGIVAINVCYDAEFPLIARGQAAAGAQLILVPSCTDTLAGYHRVRIGCQARALENQCYVLQAPTVGEAPWSEAVDVNVGAAGVFTPADRDFPSDGVLALGTLNAAQWLFADLGFERVEGVRHHGQVLNQRDWSRQRADPASIVTFE